MSVRWYILGGALGIAALIVMLFGVRGTRSDKPPLQIFPDMKVQPKLRAQGANSFFADRRDMRLPPPGTVAYGGRNYPADAGHIEPNPDFLQDDDAYYRGLITPDKNRAGALGGVSAIGQLFAPDPLTRATGSVAAGAFWQTDARVYIDGIPARKASADDPRWQKLTPKMLEEGRETFNYTCALCHGLTGNGKGMTRLYGMQPANLHDPAIVSQPDGKIYDTITNGRASMKGYAHMIRPEMRWKVLAYVRALQRSQRASEADFAGVDDKIKREVGIQP
jgi:mono/diheme cytochrome c family protein